MAKAKFKFDPESLQFTKQDTKSQFIKNFIGVFIAGMAIAIALLFVSSYIVIKPSIKVKKRENTRAKEDLEELREKYSQMEQVLKDLEKRNENVYKVILESDPNENNNDSTSKIGEVLKMLEGKRPTEIAKYIEQEIDKVLEGLSGNDKTFKDFAKVLDTKAKMLVHIPSIQPIKNEFLDIIVYGFGKRIDPFYKTPKDHNGMDYGVPEGTRVYATANGTVSYAGMKRGDGKVIEINHGYGFKTFYTHLDKIIVSRGKKVERGDYIGTTGNSGKSMSPHLHYEIHLNDKPVNPVNFFFADLNANQYNKLIRLSSRGGVSLD